MNKNSIYHNDYRDTEDKLIKIERYSLPAYKPQLPKHRHHIVNKI